jgi:uncharacterized protein YdhG (YjbR/CyaY superfamily)
MPATIDEYLSAVSSEGARGALERLRAIIHEEVPGVEEHIKYGIPTFKLNGFLASIAAFKNHCSFFPGHTVRDFSKELDGYKVLKGTIQFRHDKPLPEELVRAIVRARRDENLAGSDPASGG